MYIPVEKSRNLKKSSKAEAAGLTFSLNSGLITVYYRYFVPPCVLYRRVHSLLPSHTHLLSRVWTSRRHRCRPFFPPVLACSFFIAHRVQQSRCFSIFQRVFANSRSRAFSKLICAKEKVPTNVCEYALGGIRTQETDLYQARG